MRVDVQLDWSVRAVQWGQWFFHRCDVKSVFPVICDLIRSLRNSSKRRLPLIHVGRDPPSGFPDLTVPIWGTQYWKWTCLATGFLMAKGNLLCCCSLFSHILDQLSLYKYLYAKCCCQCWCCLCLAVTGSCNSAVRWQRSYFRGAFSKDSTRTGECRSAHCTQHRWIFKYQMPPQDPAFLHKTLMASTFAFPIMFLLSHQFHEGSCGTGISSLINSVCQASSAWT